MTQSPASLYLSQKNIPHQEYTHQGRVVSIAQAAAERNQDISQVVRSILFRLTENEYFMVLITGTLRVSWHTLRKYFKQSRLTLATQEEVLEVTGFEIGSVTPFGMKSQVPIYVDQSVFRPAAVSIGSGVQGTAILLTVKNLKKALGNISVVEFAERY